VYTADPLWERACSRWGHHIQHHCGQILRYRRNAARSKLAPTVFSG